MEKIEQFRNAYQGKISQLEWQKKTMDPRSSVLQIENAQKQIEQLMKARFMSKSLKVPSNFMGCGE
jgi:hypothetical protein